MKIALMAHRGGEQFGKEHSKEVIGKSIKRRYDLIELDVRKSSDGTLYCYHGTALEFVLARFLLKRHSFHELKETRGIYSLKELLKIIGNKADIFLDVKEEDITKQDLVAACSGIRHRRIYLARTNLRYLKSLGKLPTNWKKVQNGALALTPDIKKLRSARVAIFEGLFWSARKKNIELLKRNGMNYALVTWFLSKERYAALSRKYAMEWIHSEKL